MLDFISRTVRTAANVVTLPVSMVADVVTFGGELTDRHESYTESKARRIARDGAKLMNDVAG
jgi:hypothetical protein